MDGKPSRAIIRPRVLVVDDDRAMRETTCGLLERDFEVASADEGPAALALLETSQFDVLCTDYRMPGMTGLELIALALAMPKPPSAVLVTAYSEFALRDRSIPRPPFLLVVKPYSPLALIEAVHRAYGLVCAQRQLVTVVSSLGARGPSAGDAG